MHACVYVSIYVRTHACMYVCMYACMYVTSPSYDDDASSTAPSLTRQAKYI